MTKIVNLGGNDIEKLLIAINAVHPDKYVENPTRRAVRAQLCNRKTGQDTFEFTGDECRTIRAILRMYAAIAVNSIVDEYYTQFAERFGE